jgi:hypothetical protein
MIKDLETSSRHQEYLKKIRKKLMEESKKYKENIEHMKEFQEETYKKKNNDLINKLKKKRKIIINIIRKQSKNKNERKAKGN